MMMRKLVLFAIVATAVAALSSGPLGLGSVARAQSTATVDVVIGQPILQDNFDDNKRGTLWKTFIEDPNCTVRETNKQLQLEAKAKSVDRFAGYLGDGWWIDPKTDFALKVDLFHDLVTMDGGWVSFGLTPTPQAPRAQYLWFGIGSVNRNLEYREEWKDSSNLRWDFTSRPVNRTTLYLSYVASNDTLYLSDVGYGSKGSWQAIPGLVRGHWDRKPLFIFLGEIVDGALIGPGHAYLDNFMIEAGTVVKTHDPGEPNDPNDPNEPTDPNEPDVAADVLVRSSVIHRAGTPSITVMALLPKGIRPSDVNDQEPLTLWPGGAAATKRAIFVRLSGRTTILASFDTAGLLEAVPDNDIVEVRFFGYLKDERSFGGTYPVTIKP